MKNEVNSTIAIHQDSKNPRNFQRRVEKPWGHEIIWGHTDRYVGKILHINAGHQLSLQYHNKKEETIMILTGVMDFVVETKPDVLETIRLHPGESYHIRPLMKHRMIAVETCDVAEVSTPELDDVVRLSDAYGRSGT